MTTQTEQGTVRRDYKSTMFTMIFSDKRELLKIYEHQSTYNPNMPLRFLIYLADLYADMVKGKNLYGTKIIPLPAPRFIVFYNGSVVRPDQEELHLSDAYVTDDGEVYLELCVTVLNINIGHNQELLKACKTLHDYSEYVYRVRRYAKEMSIEEAVDKAIDECIRENILREFLEKNRAEARSMSIYEYNEEEHMKMEREEAFEDGRKAEQANTEKERQRADAAETRVTEVETENKKLREEIARLKGLE